MHMALAISSMTLLGSCAKDLCKDVVCENGGTCDEGNCKCALGHEGTMCENEMRTKFIGIYTFNESCGTDADVHQVNVKASAASVERVMIEKMHGTFNVEATVNTSTTLDIKSQVFGSDTIQGSGSISGKTLTLTYQIKQSLTTINCTGSGPQL